MIVVMNNVICRHCGEAFTPMPGKPGYLDECPECLHEKTAQHVPKEDPVMVEFDRAVKGLRRRLAKSGVKAEAIDTAIQELEKMARATS
jgi:hypothetical protein